MLDGYYYENYGDHINQDFSLWYLDKKNAKLMIKYEKDFGILSLEKKKKPLRVYSSDEFNCHIEEGIQDGVAGKFPKDLAKKILKEKSIEEIRIVLDEFFER